MKFSKKDALSFYVGIITASVIIALIESSVKEQPFEYNYFKIVLYAVLAIIFGFWQGRKKQKKVEQ
ncbi:MAG: hypothetical protein AAF960_06685 [Bacteroidota bacterium]